MHASATAGEKQEASMSTPNFLLEQHTQREEVLEAAFHDGQDESVFPMFHHLCTKPAFLFQSAQQDSSEGAQWKAKYHDHCQLIYSAFQQH